MRDDKEGHSSHNFSCSLVSFSRSLSRRRIEQRTAEKRRRNVSTPQRKKARNPRIDQVNKQAQTDIGTKTDRAVIGDIGDEEPFVVGFPCQPKE